jgi:primosomal protein N' (replication factor Y) (superfamily II helicase)
LRFCQVALDTPLRRLFDYRLPLEFAAAQPGARVRVPFGRQQLVGILVRRLPGSDVPEAKLRDVSDVIDAEPLFNAADLALLEWAASYYHHPIGEVFATALPRLLREGRNPAAPQPHWSITAAGLSALQENALRRAPKQRLLLEALAHGELDEAALDLSVPGSRELARKLVAKGWLLLQWRAVIVAPQPGLVATREPAPTLSTAQEAAVQALRGAAPGNFLLDGVTGSGKTEVYLRAVGDVLTRSGSVLLLCPEIGLTPQLLQRFERRFDASIATLHSGLTDTERAVAWHRCATGQARILIGTRSAVFTPIPQLALIIVDEEHDVSYKQQEGGFRYSARDLALLRGQQQKVTVVLGSATPSLESLHNVATGRLTHLLLPERAGSAVPPRLALIDMRAHAVHKGIAAPVLQSMRGYAPTLLCQGCGWVAPCHNCDARMTVHLRSNRLACHHCGADEPMPERCPRCGYEVHPLGHGTERVEETLAERFPSYPIERFDRDVLRQQQQLEGAIDRVHSGSARILVGTQMLTKGHHFPDVTLVVVLNADQSLFSTDFRAAERLAQTIVQVAGRAGRAEHPGEVLIQTGYPDHPLLQTLLNKGYAGFATQALAERQAARWPPFARLALLRASDTSPDGASRFLEQAAVLVTAPPGVKLLGPVPAAMMRRAGRHHAQLLVESANRAQLQQFLDDLVPRISQLQPRRSLRWALDVDPLEVF